MIFPYQAIPMTMGDFPVRTRPCVVVYFVVDSHETPAPIYAMLDSGSDDVILPTFVSDELGIKNIADGQGPFYCAGLNDQAIAMYRFMIGVRIYNDNRVLRMPAYFSGGVSVPLLGRPFFSHFSEIIFREQKQEIELRP